MRVVAYIYNNVPVTREELGEYLIARFGATRLEFLINRKVIDMACAQRGIVVSDAEIEAQYQADLKGFKVSHEQFVNNLLKRRGQTLFEWKEDNIRPRLQMNRFCRDNVVVTDEDLLKGFEAKYGDKVQCKMIVLSPQQKPMKDKIWLEVKDSDEAFDKWASQSCIPEVASQKGMIPPIHRHFPDKRIETDAFSLQPGQVGAVIGMEDGTYVILKCVKHLPGDQKRPDLNKDGALRKQLYDEIFEAKLPAEIQRVFQLLRQQADPKVFLRHEASPQDVVRDVEKQLKAGMSGN
jgi:hypothetical protein